MSTYLPRGCVTFYKEQYVAGWEMFSSARAERKGAQRAERRSGGGGGEGNWFGPAPNRVLSTSLAMMMTLKGGRFRATVCRSTLWWTGQRRTAGSGQLEESGGRWAPLAVCLPDSLAFLPYPPVCCTSTTLNASNIPRAMPPLDPLITSLAYTCTTSPGRW